MRRDLFRRSLSINDDTALGFFLCDFQIALTHSSMEVCVFLFKPVELAGQAGCCNFGRQVKNDRFVGLDIGMYEVSEHLDFFQAAPTAVPLVGDRSIREAVAENPFTGF